MQQNLIHISTLLCCVAFIPARAATYKEAGGRVTVEAEHFDARTVGTDNQRWQIVPDENGNPGTPVDAGFANARDGKYMQSLPDDGPTRNTVAQVGIAPVLDYKVQISNPGQYRLWLRWGGWDGASDSLYAEIVELKTPAGPGPNWYRYARQSLVAGSPDFDAGWNGVGAPSTDAANNVGGGGGEVPAVWNISTAGTYTIRLSQREAGSAVDAVLLQLTSLSDPANPGPAESLTTTQADTNAPTITGARTAGNPNGLIVTFSEAVLPLTATNILNYGINNGVNVTGAQMWGNDFTVLLTTTTIAPGQAYVLTVNNVQDAALPPNSIAANTQVPFLQVGGTIEQRFFFGITGTTVADLTNSAKFMNNQPDLVMYRTSFEGPVDFANDYGTQMRGYITPPATGDYIFFFSADDNAVLFLSTDDNPANKAAIAAETGWSASRNWVTSPGSDVTAKRSDQYALTEWPAGNTITLTNGRRYYVEALMKEGGGGDNLAVTWQIPGGVEPVNGDAPISGQFLSPFGITPGPVSIVTGPANQTIQEPGTATFSVVAGGSPPFSYQWLNNGVAIAGATSQSYTTPLLLRGATGTRYSVRVSNEFSSTTSSEATVTVTPDVTAPAPVTVTSVSPDFQTVTLTFNERMATNQSAAGYVFTPGNIAATNVTVDASGSNVTIRTGTALTAGVTNTLALSGATDLAGNPTAGGTSIQFVFNRVTYAANILFDEPVAYYRFEEPAASTTATNSGTSASTAGDALYVSDLGGTGPAKGEAGPRPGTFAGFDANNRAASFDLAEGDWVNTQNAFLNGLRAFSLEYWVKPVRTNTVDGTVWPNRVGIVGQNDAIEYGFITPGTIQIWTPGGGALDTPYPYPDNEWHHVATIADGTGIRNYFDGALVGSGGSALAATGDYGTSTFNVNIGGGGVFDGSGNFFNGQIDEVAIFDKAIPASRIAGHYQAGKSGGVLTVSGAVNVPTGTQLSAVRSGNTLAISWSPAGGTLETTTSLSGTPSWSDVGTANPTNITIPQTGNAFFRVRR